jgi:hypothetical protein
MFRLSIRCSGWPPSLAHRVRRFVINIVERVNEPGVQRQHHWLRLIERIIDGLLRAGHAVSNNVIGKNYSSTSAGILRTVTINLSSRLSTSRHLSL